MASVDLGSAVSHAGRPQEGGVSPPAGDLAGVGQVEVCRDPSASELSRHLRRRRPAVDLRAGSPAGNGLQIANVESAEDATAGIDRVLPENGALDLPDTLGTTGPLRAHRHAQVGRQVADLRRQRISRAAGREDAREGEGEMPPVHAWFHTTVHSLPPGPTTPRALQTMRWLARPVAMLEDCARRYGEMFTLRITHEGTWVFLTNPGAAQKVFKGDPRLLHAGEANVVLLPVLGSQSLLLLDGNEHMAQRKLMLPSFHGQRLRRYEQTMADVAARELERWQVGIPFATWPTMQRITLEVIVRTVFGVQQDERLRRISEAVRHVLAWGTDPRRMAMVAALGPRRIAEIRAFRRVLEPADAMLYEEIRRRRSAPDLAERDDVLSLLLQARHEDGSPMSDKELRDELMTLLTAGHETTATSLAWALEALARHPAALTRLREEVLEGDGDAYLDAVVKETLRLRPVVGLVLRRLMEPMEIGGHLLPAGANVAPCIYLLHRRPDLYPEPRAFRPERFLDRPAGTYTWIPFGGGVRRCLGASFAQFEMKVVLRGVVSRFDLRAAGARPERRIRRAIVFAPSRGGEVVAERRLRGDHARAEPSAHAATAEATAQPAPS